MTDAPVRRYQVVYSDLVQDELEAILRSAGGRALDLLLAFRKADYLLAVYPQFGEPVRDLLPGQTEYVASFGPLFIRYVIDESNSAVYVTVPILDRPGTGSP